MNVGSPYSTIHNIPNRVIYASMLFIFLFLFALRTIVIPFFFFIPMSNTERIGSFLHIIMIR
jgi:hypothetical protein